TLSMDAVQKANSGHPGMPMGMADVAAVLFSNYLNFNPRDTQWINRDRFVLSAGHGSMLLYSLLHLFDYDLPLEELRKFRQWESKTPGHPEFEYTPGVETTTGPLGQGFANGVGLAISGKLMANDYSKELFDYNVYGIVSDGDLMEGVALEAASLAGHLALDNLIYFYDDNEISIGGSTDVCFTEDVAAKFEACNWFVQKIDGHDFAAIHEALDKALAEKNKPSLIVARTIIAKGSPNKAGTADSHGAPLGKEEVLLSKREIGWPEDKDFLVPDEVRSHCAEAVENKIAIYSNWKEKFNTWKASNQEGFLKLESQLDLNIPVELRDELFSEMSKQGKAATRNLSGQAIQIIAKHLPFLIGGSADLEPSNKTLIKNSGEIQPGSFSGRNIRFGVREHAMGSIVNGLAYTRNWIPYTGTFLVFADYMRPPMRLAALSHLQSIFVFTHDSIWVGEDGPTHQPIEQIASLRAIPNFYVYRPADAWETALCYWAALNRKKAPSALLLTRQDVPVIEREKDPELEVAMKGAYVVSGADKDAITLVATGSEVWLAVEAAAKLNSSGHAVRAVSMPCMDAFLDQDESFRNQIIPSKSKKVSIEAGSKLVWSEVVGSDALNISIDRFGASAPGEVVAEKFGFTTEQVIDKILNWL
ncbi:MAG: transketolase, partial [Bdellovibrionales bacterium]|nr:transketolase [Bdellovibrionales bacterium]